MENEELELMIQRLNDLLDAGKLSEFRKMLIEMNEVDIAQYMEELDSNRLLLVFRVLPKDISADVFAYMTSEQQQLIIESITDRELSAIVDDLYLDDAVDFLEELPASVVKRVLRNTNETTRNLINQFLQYPDNSAGSIMTIEFVEFHAHNTVREAMDILKRTGVDKETIDTCFVIDERRRLIGFVGLRDLIFAREEEPIAVVMDDNVVSVHTLDDQEAVADTVRKYDLINIPVVDNEDRLVGIITSDDIMDVIEEENTEDMELMNALVPAETEYLKTSVWGLAKNRIPWLLILMISATFTGLIISKYEGLLMAAVGLNAFIPMLMDTSGNCGSQSSTLIIRGLALGEVEFKDFFKVLWKEIRVGVICGLVLALVNFFRIWLFTPAEMLTALVVSLTLLATVILSKAIGCTLPLLAKKCKLDPAIMASPLITTIVDASSLMIFFYIATVVLKIG